MGSVVFNALLFRGEQLLRTADHKSLVHAPRKSWDQASPVRDRPGVTCGKPWSTFDFTVIEERG